MKHKWHKEIKAWADGAEIEYKNNSRKICWTKCEIPEFYTKDGYEYRIKPTPEQAEQAEKERIRKMAEKALSIPEISDAVDRLFEAFKEPQYLYVYQKKGAGLELGFAPHEGTNMWETKIIGKIKLEEANGFGLG